MQSFLQYRRIQAGTRKVHQEVDSKPPSNEALDAGPELVLEATLPPSSKKPIIAAFTGPDDPLNPQNWPASKKTITFAIVGVIGLIVGFGSAVDIPVLPQASAHFGVSDTTESLATSLYLIGFGCGAPIAGPLSEAFGRNAIFISTFSLFCCWILGAALAPNIGGQLVFRFLAGFVGSTPFTTAGGTLSDIFTHQQRALVFPLLALVAFVGPCMAPVVGAYIGHSGMNWRWAEWVTLCISGGILAIMVLFLPETYPPLILTWKARALRVETGDSNHKSQLELSSTGIVARLKQALSRPFVMLFTEPIIVLFTMYLTLVYSVLFSFFDGAPFIFGGIYDFNQGATFLMFVGVTIGLIVCTAATPLFMVVIKKEFVKAAKEGRDHPPPEAMLWQAMVGAPLLPISLWWMAWSARASVSFWAPIVRYASRLIALASILTVIALCLWASAYLPSLFQLMHI